MVRITIATYKNCIRALRENLPEIAFSSLVEGRNQEIVCVLKPFLDVDVSYSARIRGISDAYPEPVITFELLNDASRRVFTATYPLSVVKIRGTHYCR